MVGLAAEALEEVVARSKMCTVIQITDAFAKIQSPSSGDISGLAAKSCSMFSLKGWTIFSKSSPHTPFLSSSSSRVYRGTVTHGAGYLDVGDGHFLGPDISILGIGNFLKVVLWLWEMRMEEIEMVRAKVLRRRSGRLNPLEFQTVFTDINDLQSIENFCFERRGEAF